MMVIPASDNVSSLRPILRFPICVASSIPQNPQSPISVPRTKLILSVRMSLVRGYGYTCKTLTKLALHRNPTIRKNALNTVHSL